VSGVIGRIFNTGTGPAQLAASFAIPLMGCLGDCFSYLPSVAEFTIEFQVADIVGRKLIDFNTAASSLPTGFILSELSLIVDVVQFADRSYFDTITRSPISIKTSTTLYTSAPLAAGQLGVVDNNLLSRCMSAKRLMYRFSSANDAITGIYGSSNPNSRSACLFVSSWGRLLFPTPLSRLPCRRT
jgi:hypothetical protein